MITNIIIWILSVGKMTWEYDKFFSNQQFEKNLSESYHFIIFSLIFSIIFYTLHRKIIKKNKKNLIESLYFIIFITAIGASCRNPLGKDVTQFHYITYSLELLYCIYIHKQCYPKEETLIIIKITISCLVVLKILWPPLIYVWPYWPRKKNPYPEDLLDDWFDVDL
jgi:hypothetical protein